MELGANGKVVSIVAACIFFPVRNATRGRDIDPALSFHCCCFEVDDGILYLNGFYESF
jgi:hypothetical protein